MLQGVLFFKNAIKKYKFEHFIYKMLNTLKYNISISLGCHKFMDIQLNGITVEDKSKIVMDYTKWHAGVYNISYFDSLRFALGLTQD